MTEHLAIFRDALMLAAQHIDDQIAAPVIESLVDIPSVPAAADSVTPINPDLPLIWQDKHCGFSRDEGRFSIKGDHVHIELKKGDHVDSVVKWSPELSNGRQPIEAVAECEWFWPENFPTQKMQSAKYFGLQFGATAGGGLVGGNLITDPDARRNPLLNTGWSARVTGGSRHMDDSFRGYLYDAGRHQNDDRNWRPDQNKLYGDTVFGDVGKPSPGKWTSIAIRYIANTPGLWDGVCELWVDGRIIIREDDRLWSMDPPAHPEMFFVISHMWGGTPSKSPVPWDTYNMVKDARVWARYA